MSGKIEMSTSDALIECLRAVVRPQLGTGDALNPLIVVLIEQALNFERHDGTVGSPAEVRALVTAMVNGHLDILVDQRLAAH